MATLQIIRSLTGGPAHLDTAAARAVLEGVAAERLAATFILTRATRVVAFGRQDTVRSGYPGAVALSREAGFEPVERLAGGRAAVFHEHAFSFSLATPEAESRTGIADRFDAITALLSEAFTSLGLDARIGLVPGEYCPGDSSINLFGTRKVMGVGQRLIKGAAHVGGVIVVDRPDLVNLPLIPVYRGLGYEWDPGVTGALTDGDPGLTIADAEDAIIAALGRRFDLEPATLDPVSLERATVLAPEHVPR